MLSEKERDMLLIRLDERMVRMRDDQKEIKDAMNSKDGFARCQLHTQSITDIIGSLRWTKRAAAAAFLTIVGKIVWGYLSPLFGG